MSFLPTFMLLCYVYFLHFMLSCYVYVLHVCCYAMFMFCIYVVMLCLCLAFMLSCNVYVLHLCCHEMFIFAFMLLCYVYYFAFMLLCYVYFFAFMLLCYIYFLNLCCYAMFFCFIVACTPMPACPANYQRLGIPADIVLHSCYRAITAPAPVDFHAAAVSICTCCKLCWRISKYMYLM